MPFDFGPEPIQAGAYLQADVPLESEDDWWPSGLRKATKVQTFYDATRKRMSAPLFCWLCLALPAALLAMSLAIATSASRGLFSAAVGANAFGLDALPIFCAGALKGAPFADANLSSLAPFSAAHVGLAAAASLAIVGGSRTAGNVLLVHGRRSADAIFLAYVCPALAAAALLVAANDWFGGEVAAAFAQLLPFDKAASRAGCLLETWKEHKALETFAKIGLALVAWGVTSLAAAAATIAYRFEIGKIDGAWADSYVLRHKLKGLLTQFFVGSVLLVASNLAVASYTATATTVVDYVQAADSGAKAADSKAATDANAPKAVDVGAEAAKRIGTLRGTLIGFVGSVGSLLLIAIFAPAFYALKIDIEIAGKVHAGAEVEKPDPSPPPPKFLSRVTAGVFDAGDGLNPTWAFGDAVRRPGPTAEGNAGAHADGAARREALPGKMAAQRAKAIADERVAGFKVIQDWKERHGLNVSFGQMTGSFVAALAPILSGGAIDLTKALTGV